MKKIPKIEFAPKDKIDDFAHELVKELFGIENAFMSNESKLEDFEHEDEVPGHKLKRFYSVPLQERKRYLKQLPKFIKLDKYRVWYPPISGLEQNKINKETRQKLLTQIRRIYGISVDDCPLNEPLYVWKIAMFVKKKLSQN